MATTPGQVREQFSAFVDSIDKLTAKEREKTPTAHYGERFNQLLSLAKETCKGVDQRLWPNELVITDYTTNRAPEATYVEIATYARQVIAAIPR